MEFTKDKNINLIKRNIPRDIVFTPHVNPYAHGSVIVEFGRTKVHVTAFVEEQVPPYIKSRNTHEGWVTAEYNMLPASSQTRIQRERKGVGGRTYEIQRLIGRSMRAIVDTKKLGERTITLDCDVLVADGGTRTASISGGFVALSFAVMKLIEEGKIKENPIRDFLAAISVGINKEGLVLSDLNYEEDSTCDTDMNIVMTSSGKYVEVQGTAEGNPFSEEQLQALLECAKQSLQVVFEKQREVLNVCKHP